MDLQRQINYALAHPVFDPGKHIVEGHGWIVQRDSLFGVSGMLTVNIGME